MKLKIFLSAILVVLICSILTYTTVTVKASENDTKLPPVRGVLYQHGQCGIVPLDGANYVVEDRTTGQIMATGITSEGGQWGGTAAVGHRVKITCTYQGKVGCIFVTQVSSGLSGIQICMTKYNACPNEE